MNNNLEYAEELQLSDGYKYAPVVHVIEQHEVEDASNTSIEEIMDDKATYLVSMNGLKTGILVLMNELKNEWKERIQKYKMVMMAQHQCVKVDNGYIRKKASYKIMCKAKLQKVTEYDQELQ